MTLKLFFVVFSCLVYGIQGATDPKVLEANKPEAIEPEAIGFFKVTLAGSNKKGVVFKSLHENLFNQVLRERNTGNTKSPCTLPRYPEEDEYNGISVELYYKTKMEIYLFEGSKTLQLQLDLLKNIQELPADGRKWLQNKISEQWRPSV